ncbi:MAG: hypothetical protein KatS3mg013_0670 [Actinomycetota bacterium]|jgi:pilus assembly protein Flp/PilA|nr:MAG: hypothetical protein KatS3mg013_0670 [Actinomycetota bacterium]
MERAGRVLRARWAGLAEERGATAIEYALMLALIAMVIVAAVAYLGQSTNDVFANFSFEPAP